MPNNIEKELESLKLEVQLKRYNLFTSNGSIYFYRWLIRKITEIIKKAGSSEKINYPERDNI